MGFLSDLLGKIAEWFWQHLIGPAIQGTFAFIPLWLWIVLGGVGVGYLFKKFGWQGVIGGVGAFLLFMAYRQGWKNATDLHRRAKDGGIEVSDEPTFSLPIPDLPATDKGRAPRPKLKQRYDPETNTWVDIVPRKR